ncbi:MAG TPA: hypothetical protein VM778_06535 [Gemmatimonadota bacterium]|nr:hypothetical protein [Gemmatimonadota bacterium]
MRPVPLAVTASVVGLLAACADPGAEPGAVDSTSTVAAEVESLSLSTADEIRAEIEMLGYEIGDLEMYLASAPRSTEADPAVPLAQARAAHAAASQLLTAGDTAASVDSLEAVHARVEEVKRSLALAEEWGEEIEDEPPP